MTGKEPKSERFLLCGGKEEVRELEVHLFSVFGFGIY